MNFSIASLRTISDILRSIFSMITMILNIIDRTMTNPMNINVLKFSPSPNFSDTMCASLGDMEKENMAPQMIVAVKNLNGVCPLSLLKNFKDLFAMNDIATTASIN